MNPTDRDLVVRVSLAGVDALDDALGGERVERAGGAFEVTVPSRVVRLMTVEALRCSSTAPSTASSSSAPGRSSGSSAPGAARPRALFLVGASYGFYFYGTWDAARDEPLPLTAAALGAPLPRRHLRRQHASTSTSGARSRGVTRPAARNALLCVSLVYYLGVLAFFKYWNFAADSFASLAAALGAHVQRHAPAPRPAVRHLVLHVRDDELHDRRLAPRARAGASATSTTSSSSASSRTSSRAPSCARRRCSRSSRRARAPTPRCRRAASGASRPASRRRSSSATTSRRPSSTASSTTPERFTALEVLIADYAYAIQIYADFSGYTDVAIGSAALFGYELPENFDAPYVSREPPGVLAALAHLAQHLAARLPLQARSAARARGRCKTYRNLMITMVLGGLWHGASWNFVVWGALHGAALAATRMWQRARARHAVYGALDVRPPLDAVAGRRSRRSTSSASRGSSSARRRSRTRRSRSRSSSGAVGRSSTSRRRSSLVARGGGAPARSPAATGKTRLRETFVRTPALVQGLVLAAAAFALHLAAAAKPEPFVYGQF